MRYTDFLEAVHIDEIWKAPLQRPAMFTPEVLRERLLLRARAV